MEKELPYRDRIRKVSEKDLSLLIGFKNIINENDRSIVGLLLQIEEEKSLAKKIKASEEEFKKLLRKKYGEVNIDLDSGYFTPLNVDIEPEIDMDELEKVDQPKFEALSKTNIRK